ncbi:Uncharacterized protein FWK35_00015694 [Aphis craccivora]|uniref:Uncharacterized protein n=1 Tax=Aphis craccivora TaxID=307492 RepID=A0A6G0Y4Q6_APHCR|nr:Uncharacterized protein FWK35_00015694 [Aphis craccivora]
MEADIIVDDLDRHNHIYLQLIDRIKILNQFLTFLVLHKYNLISLFLLNFQDIYMFDKQTEKNSKGESIPGYPKKKYIQTYLFRLRALYHRSYKYIIETRLMVLKSDLYIIFLTIMDEDNFVDELKRFEPWDDIIRARNSLTYHTEKLYNSIFSKSIGGKRINFFHKVWKLVHIININVINGGRSRYYYAIVIFIIYTIPLLGKYVKYVLKLVNDILFGTFTENCTRYGIAN